MMNSTLRLHIIVTNPPPDSYQGHPAVFGLQDKSGSLTPGTPAADGSLLFECDVAVSVKDDKANFTGKWAHGTPQDDLFARQFDVPDAAIGAYVVRFEADGQ